MRVLLFMMSCLRDWRMGVCVVVAIVAMLVGGAGVLWLFICERSEESVAVGPMRQEVYVWQRVWTGAVDRAVDERLPVFDHSTLLVGEIGRDRAGRWRVEVFDDALNYAKEHEVTLAVRIGSGAGAGPGNSAQGREGGAQAGAQEWDGEAVGNVVEMLKLISGQTHVIQIDYDCPTSKLAGYVKLCRVLRREFPDHTLEITCLPDWLNSEAFKSLVQGVDRFVMQVHGVSGFGGSGTLCDPNLARRSAERCGEFGVPYLMALPTYRHAILRNADGVVVEVVSEGRGLRAGKAYELMSAQPDEMAGLVRYWQKVRPEKMEGVIWYRLPVEGETMNWTWDTMQKVMRGDEVLAKGTLKMVLDDEGAYRLVFENNTKANIEWPGEMEVSWGDGVCVVADGVGAYSLARMDRRSGVRCVWNAKDPRPIAPGRKVEVAWFRFDSSQVSSFTLKIRGE